MFDSKLNYESSLWIDGYKMTGVSMADISYSNSQSIAKPLGYSAGFSVSTADSAKNISISRDLLLTKTGVSSLWEDYLLKYTGANEKMKASLNYENGSYGFVSGYMTEYMLNFAIGAIPKVTTNFVVLDSMYSGVDASLPNTSFKSAWIPYQSMCRISCDNVSSNRVVGFDYSIKINRKPVYSIGSSSPVDIDTIPPLEYSAAVQIEVDDAFLENSQSFITNKENKTVNISIDTDGIGNSNVTFAIPKASLVSEQLSASADGLLKLTLNYVGHS